MTVSTQLVKPDAIPVLHEDSLHQPYFKSLRRALSALCAYYAADEKTEDYETRSIAEYFHQLLFTVEALEMKYAYRHEAYNSMWIDILGSGFPTLMVMAEISADLANKEQRLAGFPKREMLLQLSLDYMFKTGSEPEAILWQLAEISYLRMLDQRKVFLPYAGHAPERDASDVSGSKLRTYQVAWECYDFLTNRPYVHAMKFHQDAHEDVLEENPSLMQQVVNAIKAEGSKASDVGILASSIDEAVEWLHPKYLRRIGLGPFYTRAALLAMDQEDWEDAHVAVHEALTKHGTAEDDYMLFFNHEVVFSREQVVMKGNLLRGDKIREVFFLPEVDPEGYKRHASIFEPHVLLSHSMLQSLMQDPLADRIPLFRRAKKITYDERGGINVFN